MEFIHNMTTNNRGLWFHIWASVFGTKLMLEIGVDNWVNSLIVMILILGYETMQYIWMRGRKLGWSWTPYRSRIKWQADTLGDIVGAATVHWMILYKMIWWL